MNTEQEREFHGQIYKINLQQQGSDKLQLILEGKYDYSIWKNTFHCTYIEDLTQKTGFKRKFTDFCYVLLQAIKQENTSQISMDILTYQDLENMKAKKSGLPNPTPAQLNPAQVKANKRYIILSVSTSNQTGDKVHYPLTLNHEEVNDVDKLKQTVRQLKMELSDVKSSRDNLSGIHSTTSNKGESFFITENMDRKGMNSTNSSIQSHASEPLLQENEILRTKVKRLEESFQQKVGALEVDSLMKSKLDLEIEYDTMRIQSAREISRLKNDLDQREAELLRKRQEVLNIQKDLTSSLTQEEIAQKLRQHIAKLSEETEKEIVNSRKTIHVLQKENDKFHTDVDFFKRSDQKQKNRIRQLEIELETAVKRGSKINDRIYSPYNKTGQQASTAGRRANSVPVKSYSPSNRFNQKPAVSKPGAGSYGQRNNSNEANKSRLSPSYNYGYQKNKVGSTGTTGTNRPSYAQNTASTRTTGTYNRSPGYQANTRTGVTNSGVNNRVSPNNRNSNSNLTNNRTSPGQNTYNRTNAQRVSPGVNSQPNRVSPGNNRVSPSNRVPGTNTNTNRVSPGVNSTNTNRVSPGQRGGYNQPLQRNQNQTNKPSYGQKNPSPGARYQNQSPGTRYNNYMNQNKKPGVPTQNTNNQQIQNQFNDKHLNQKQQQQVPNQNKDLDNRLDRLQGLLQKAKK